MQLRYANLFSAFLLCAAACGDDSSPAVDSGVDSFMADGAFGLDGGVGLDEAIDIDPTLDTDNDGVPDVDEVNVWRTSPTVADSDGDGFDDGVEINDLAFDPEVNNFQFNPLIADRPELDIELALAPVIYAVYETTSGTTETIGRERSTETRAANTRSWGGSSSYAVEQSHTVGGSAGFSGWSFEASVSYEYSYSTTNETSSEWSEEQTTENAETNAAMESFESSNEIATTGGVLGISVEVRNPGNIAYFLDNLTLTAYELDPLNPENISPVGTLTFLDGLDTFPRTRLEPGESSAPLTFDTELDLPTTKALLRNSRNLMIAPATSLVEGDGTVDFELAATAVNARTAEVIIDFGDERPAERYRVSTVSNGEDNFITAETAFRDVLRIPYEQGTVPFRRTEDGVAEDTLPMLTSVRNLGTSDEDTTLWTVIHSFSIENGASTDVRQYHPLSSELDFGALELRKGDTLQLTRIVDVDRDGLGERAEYAFGTDPSNPDTDADGCRDGFEVVGWDIDDAFFGTRRVRSNPRLANTDGDRLNDCEEFEARTDPSDSTNIAPTVDAELEVADGIRAVFRVEYDDEDTSVVALRYTIDGGSERVVDVTGETSPVDIEHIFSSAGDHEFSVVAFDGQLDSEPSVVVYNVGIPLGASNEWPIQGDSDLFDGFITDDAGGLDLRAENIAFVTGRNGLGRSAADVNFLGENGLMTTDPVALGRNFTMVTFIDFGRIFSDQDVFGHAGIFSLGASSSGLTLTDLSAGQRDLDSHSLGPDFEDDGYRLIIVVVEDGNISVYVGDELVMSGTHSADDPRCQLFFGQPASLECTELERAPSSSNGVNAVFDDMRVYPRALSANEIVALELTL